MLSYFRSFTFVVIIVSFSSCATLVSKSRYNISIDSKPQNADITVKKINGEVVYKGVTPAIVKLKAGDGLFREAFYQVEYKKPGYEDNTSPIMFKFDPWYLGNCIFPGILGFVIDPIFGSLFKPRSRMVTGDLKENEDGKSPNDAPADKWDNPSRWD